MMATVGGCPGGRGSVDSPSWNFGLHVLMNKPACCLCSTVDGQPVAHRPTKLKQQRALAAGTDSTVDASSTLPTEDSNTSGGGGSGGSGDGSRLTVTDVLRANNIDPSRTSCVGRLDYESSGALLFTSDGALNTAVKAPEAGCSKVYEVHVAGRWQDDDRAVAQLSEPMFFPSRSSSGKSGKGPEQGESTAGVTTKPAQVRVVKQYALVGEQLRLDPWPWPPHGGWATVLEVSLQEGRNRQIRRLCARSKLHIRRLHRTRIGPLELDGLRAGECRALGLKELLQLRSAVAAGFSTVETLWIS